MKLTDDVILKKSTPYATIPTDKIAFNTFSEFVLLLKIK